MAVEAPVVVRTATVRPAPMGSIPPLVGVGLLGLVVAGAGAGAVSATASRRRFELDAAFAAVVSAEGTADETPAEPADAVCTAPGPATVPDLDPVPDTEASGFDWDEGLATLVAVAAAPDALLGTKVPETV